MRPVIMMVSSTRGFASARTELGRTLRRWLARALAVWLLLAAGLSAAGAAELTGLRTERADDGIYLSAQLKFDLPAAVEDALLKGIALIFVVEAEVYRERWYWSDKRVASASRGLRLAYQPLTRRWRISQANEAGGLDRVALAQSFDTLAEALSVIKSISQWKIADSAEVDAGNHSLEFRFRLDLTALPRPFQIGMAGQRDWQIVIERTQRLRLDKRAAEPPPADK